MRLHDALCRHIASVGRDGRRAGVGMADGLVENINAD